MPYLGYSAFSRMIIYGISMAALIFLVLIGNIVWYQLKAKLREKGYRTTLFYGHFRDIPNAIELARKTTNKKEKKSLIASVVTIILVILMLPVFGYLLVDNSDYKRCELYRKVINLEMEATIIAKNDYKGLDYTGDLVLDTQIKDIKSYELVMVFRDIYEQAKVGDKLTTNAGSDLLYLVSETGTSKFQIRKEEYCN